MITRNSKPMWIRDKLTRLLLKCTLIREPDEEDCIFWVWSVAVSAWTGPSGSLLPPGAILVEGQKRRFPKIVTTDQALKICKGFAWDAKLILPAPGFFT